MYIVSAACYIVVDNWSERQDERMRKISTSMPRRNQIKFIGKTLSVLSRSRQVRPADMALWPVNGFVNRHIKDRFIRIQSLKNSFLTRKHKIRFDRPKRTSIEAVLNLKISIS